MLQIAVSEQLHVSFLEIHLFYQFVNIKLLY